MNCGLRRLGLALIACVVVFPAQAGAMVLYDQTNFPTDAGTVISSDYGDASHASQGADDFTVPAGQSWSISSVDLRGSGFLTGDTATVFLLGDSAGLPGALFFSQPGVPLSGNNDFSVPLPAAPALGPGIYWISVQVTAPSVAGVWNWGATVSTAGSEAAWQNPMNGYGTGCTTFKPISMCGFSGKSFLFRLNAPDPPAPTAPAPTATATATKATKCKKKRHRHGATSAKKKKRCKRKKK